MNTPGGSLRMPLELPSDYQMFADLLSANAQLYIQCQTCWWEDRANMLYLLPPKGVLTEPCSQCGSTDHRPVRHLLSLHGRCIDCGHDLAGFKTVPWEELSCPNCRSRRLEIQQREIEPPYPTKFGEVGDRSEHAEQSDNFMRKDQPWGVDAYSDAGHLLLEYTKAVHFHPADSYSYTMCEAFLGESLLARNEYRGDDKGLARFVALLGSLMRDYFQQVGAVSVGLRSLELTEAAVDIEKDPADKACWEHNAAIMINSLLVRYSEKEIVGMTNRPEIRKEGLGYAAGALSFYLAEAEKTVEEEKIEGQEDENKAEKLDDSNQAARAFSLVGGASGISLDYSNQAARTFHLIGDLLTHGESTDEEKRQALDAYSEALKWNLPESLLPGLHRSRGETALGLDDATPGELASAWQDLEAALNADSARLGRTTSWAVLWNMARIAERLEDGATELNMLEMAARVAMAVVRQNLTEFGIQARSQSMAPLFDTLAYRYAENGKAAKALAAAEALRAATVRVHTKTKKELFRDLEAMAREAGADLAREHMRQAGVQVNLVDDVLDSKAARIDSVEPGIKRLIRGSVKTSTKTSTKTPTAIVSFSNPVALGDSYGMIAFVCGDPAKSKQPIQYKVRRPNFKGMEWEAALVRPGPFREGRLRRMHAAVGHAFIAPLLPWLKEMGIKRIVFSLPSVLSRYAFEAIPVGRRKKDRLVNQWEVGYVPSIALAMDEPKHTPRRKANLLVVGYQGDDLTYAAGEVKELRKRFGDAMTLLSGKECTKATVLKHLAKPYDYIHFVCHGTYDEDNPLNAALHLVPDVEDDRQRVTAEDVFEHVKFQQRPLITMSACSTALMSMSPVNNCHGLTGSFLRAGARGVVGSRWPVYDATSALFMWSFYEKVMGGGNASPLSCLTEVQRELAIDHGIEDFASFGYMGLP
jgi:CHAT domain